MVMPVKIPEGDAGHHAVGDADSYVGATEVLSRGSWVLSGIAVALVFCPVEYTYVQAPCEVVQLFHFGAY